MSNIPDLVKNNNNTESEANTCYRQICVGDGNNYEPPEWVEQVILIGWSFYGEWFEGFEQSILNMMKKYHINIPIGVGALLKPTPPGRCGLIRGLIRTYYLESHSDPNWSPYVSICSLTNPVKYRDVAEIMMPVRNMSQVLERSINIFNINRPFFYALFHMIQLFSSVAWSPDSGICFTPRQKPTIVGCHDMLPDLPYMVLIHILSFLDGVSIYNMSKVNRIWRHATLSTELQVALNFPDPQIYYLINFTTMGLGGNCGLSY